MDCDRTRTWISRFVGLLALAIATCVATTESRAESSALSEAAAAERLDDLLVEEGLLAAKDHGAVASRSAENEESFLRRLSLDLVGEPPSPNEITAFLLDRSADKRARAVERLLGDERFGQNWARYWRDVIMYRRSDERALIASRSVVDYLTEQFNQNTAWDEIGRSFVTATGDLAREGRTALLVSQWGEVPETAAEVSRVLLGIQIQCAQCHDHPIDDWSREQFHELAAFFPRIAVRRNRKASEGKRRIFELVSSNRAARKKKPGANKKGLEHFMPDLDDPSAKGTLMRPVFFVTGQTLKAGAPDEQRRQTLADWITAEENPWFAKAFVNRIWAEMIGKGFYEPIDDLGPDRDCSAPEAMNLLSEQFVASGHDVKWLFRTIALSEAYQPESRDRLDSEPSLFADDCTQRLRGDQLFSALAATLDLDEPTVDRRRPPRPGTPRTPRGQFNRFFGFDPSTPRDEITGTIPQALLLMNATAIHRAIRADKDDTVLAGLINEADDSEVITELYLRTLARQPTEAELETCSTYITDLDNRAEALEDILWALINSTEFLHRE